MSDPTLPEQFPLQSYTEWVEFAPIGMLTWRLDDLAESGSFRLIAANQMARQMLELKVGTAFSTPFPGFLSLEPLEVYAAVVQCNTPRDLGEVFCRTPQGAQIVLGIRAFPLPNQQLGVLFEDVTAQHQAETALRHSEQRLFLHLQQTPLGVIEWNLKAQVVEWNPAAEQLFGYSRAEALGQSIEQLGLFAETHATFDRVWKSLLSQRTRLRGIHANWTRDGQQLVCEWHYALLVDAAEGVVGVTTLVQDITDRHRAEMALQQFMQQLEQSNQELQNFASVASHDLQEPLRKIQAFGDRLVQKYGELLPAEGQDYLARMQNAAHRMQTLIRDLLALSRVTTKAKPFVEVNLNTIAAEVLSDLEVQMQQVNGRVEVGDLPTIEADPLQMRQLLQNLISNALKFHLPDRSPVVKIEAVLLSEWCQLIVTDNGIGFDQQYLDRIFTVFQRLHTRNQYEGSGVGLAICRKIAERHGGQITARSSPGQGAVFTVTLPICQSRYESPHDFSYLDRDFDGR